MIDTGLVVHLTTSEWNNPSLPVSVEEKKIKTMETIIDAKRRVKGDIHLLKDKLKMARETISKFKTELNKVQGSS